MHIFLKLKSDWLGQTNFNDFFLPILTDIILSFRKWNQIVSVLFFLFQFALQHDKRIIFIQSFVGLLSNADQLKKDDPGRTVRPETASSG
jgi:hypothetical protein